MNATILISSVTSFIQTVCKLSHCVSVCIPSSSQNVHLCKMDFDLMPYNFELKKSSGRLWRLGGKKKVNLKPLQGVIDLRAQCVDVTNVCSTSPLCHTWKPAVNTVSSLEERRVMAGKCRWSHQNCQVQKIKMIFTNIRSKLCTVGIFIDIIMAFVSVTSQSSLFWSSLIKSKPTWLHPESSNWSNKIHLLHNYGQNTKPAYSRKHVYIFRPVCILGSVPL